MDNNFTQAASYIRAKKRVKAIKGFYIHYYRKRCPGQKMIESKLIYSEKKMTPLVELIGPQTYK